MCNTTTQPTPAEAPKPETAETRSELDNELQKANVQLQLAQLRANAEYNNSLAGQMQRQFETYQRIAKPLSESNFVPAAYKGNLGDCVIAVEIAARLNVFPLTVMQNLCIVKGNPTWKSKFLIGCVNTCGRYTTMDYRFSIDGTVGAVKYKDWQKGNDGKNHEVLKPFDNPALDNLTCVAVATEKATGKVLTSPKVSIRMAIQEGWYTKDGSKWPTMAELMLRYRAASYWVSTFAPEMAMGFRTVEEAHDIEDVEFQEITSEQPAPTSRPASAAVEQAKEKLRSRQPSKANPAPAPAKTDMP